MRGPRRIVFLAALSASAALAALAAAAQDKPYRVENGRADPRTIDGYSTFISVCSACHGADARGTPAAANLLDALRAMSRADFAATVLNGRERQVDGGTRQMPAFADDPEVPRRLDALYAYLKARADGALPPGRPQPLQ